MRLGIAGRPGGIAALLARDLIEAPGISEVDFLDPGATSADLKECRLVVGCWGDNARSDRYWAEKSIISDTNYLSIGYGADALDALGALDGKAAASGRTVLMGCSFSPGLTNMLAAFTSADLQTIKSVRIAYVLSGTGSFGRMGLARTLASRSSPALVFESGALHEELSGTAAEDVFFPEPIGWRTVGLCRGAEAVLIPRTLGDVREVRVKNSIAEPPLAAMLRPAARIAGNGNGPRSLWNRVIGSIPPIRPNAAAWSAARVDVSGEAESGAARVAYGIADSLPNLISATVLTAVRLMAGGSLRPGAVFPEQIFDPQQFFAVLAQRGPRLARLSRFGDRTGPGSSATAR